MQIGLRYIAQLHQQESQGPYDFIIIIFPIRTANLMLK
jgi:hypothetical protein